MTSPNSANFPLDRRPFIISKDVRPDGLTLHRVMRTAACLMSQGTTGESIFTGTANLSSRADLIVRHWPSTSCIARSTVPLLLESPTAEFSSAVPYVVARHLETSRAMSLADVSWSLLMMILSLRSPMVSRSSAIWSTTQASDKGEKCYLQQVASRNPLAPCPLGAS